MKKLLFFLLVLFGFALNVNAQTTDLYKVIKNGTWITDQEGVEFKLWLDGNKRQFTVAEVGAIEQHYGIVGQLKAVKGKANTYTFTAQDNYNGFSYVYRGTITFTKIAGGKIKVSIECPAPEDGYSLPHQLILRKSNSKKK